MRMETWNKITKFLLRRTLENYENLEVLYSKTVKTVRHLDGNAKI